MWPLIPAAAIGIWLIASPHILGFEGSIRTQHEIFGPIATAFAVISIWNATRGVRFLLVPVGAWLVVAPLLMGSSDTTATLTSVLSGGGLIVLALIARPSHDRFGGGWTSLLPGDRVDGV